MSAAACIVLAITLGIPAVAMLLFTIAAFRDLARGSPVGITFKSWLRKAADAFFSAA
jgi:hypothetical protein